MAVMSRRTFLDDAGVGMVATLAATTSGAAPSERVRHALIGTGGRGRALLQAISDPVFCVNARSNKALREILWDKTSYTGLTTKQLSAKICRQLRLLRDHGIIRQLLNRRKYVVTTKGAELTAALNALLATSTVKLMDKAA